MPSIVAHAGLVRKCGKDGHGTGQQSFACGTEIPARAGFRDLLHGGSGEEAIAIATPHLVNDSLELVLEFDTL